MSKPGNGNQAQKNTKRPNGPAARTNKGHPKREARKQRAYERGAPRPQTD
jgi:hypothetical protein